jgi:hypothetical protein
VARILTVDAGGGGKAGGTIKAGVEKGVSNYDIDRYHSLRLV